MQGRKDQPENDPRRKRDDEENMPGSEREKMPEREPGQNIERTPGKE